MLMKTVLPILALCVAVASGCSAEKPVADKKTAVSANPVEQSNLPASAAEAFLRLVGSADYAGAVAASDPEFQKLTTAAKLKEWTELLRLGGLKTIEWRSANASAEMTDLEGVITRADDTRFPFGCFVKKGDSGWRLFGFHDYAGSIDSAGVPADSSLIALCVGTLRSFTNAVRTQNFAAFRSASSKDLQTEASAEEMRTIFAAFQANLSELQAGVKSKPILGGEPGVVGGRLVLTGHFPAGKSRLAFQFDYAEEGGDWKLAALNIKFLKQ